MAIGKVTITISEPGIRSLLENAAGPVHKHMDSVAHKVRDAAIKEAPVKTGRLKRSIRTTRDWPGLQRNAVAVVADTEYALVVENGSRPHVIVPKQASILRFPTKGGGVVYTHRVEHPGTAANPFMRRALDSVRR